MRQLNDSLPEEQLSSGRRLLQESTEAAVGLAAEQTEIP
jgi:hypothetical protein